MHVNKCMIQQEYIKMIPDQRHCNLKIYKFQFNYYFLQTPITDMTVLKCIL